ncbi:MAG: DUF3987 domain-containing protein [Maricaulis sp.]|uniref:DUF3987 domain-containing protein n=1 Tax=Maricaulis sp. TaxID=1486257 RepID=UPI002634BED8|nr:DUF3987 domain-containing protein [Maricaulis sp.]MDM7983270.1 DUF3987 domain-containing protein [Maricaulis sp.]
MGDLDWKGHETAPEWLTGIVAGIDTYSETSPSGKGLRFVGSRPLQSASYKAGDGTEGVEVYQLRRFGSFTGNIEGSAPVAVSDSWEHAALLMSRLKDVGAKASGLNGLPGGTVSALPDCDVDPVYVDRLQELCEQDTRNANTNRKNTAVECLAMQVPTGLDGASEVYASLVDAVLYVAFTNEIIPDAEPKQIVRMVAEYLSTQTYWQSCVAINDERKAIRGLNVIGAKAVGGFIKRIEAGTMKLESFCEVVRPILCDELDEAPSAAVIDDPQGQAQTPTVADYSSGLVKADAANPMLAGDDVTPEAALRYKSVSALMTNTVIPTEASWPTEFPKLTVGVSENPNPFPIESLPPRFREVVLQLAYHKKVEPGFVVLELLSALSYAMQAHYDVSMPDILAKEAGDITAEDYAARDMSGAGARSDASLALFGADPGAGLRDDYRDAVVTKQRQLVVPISVYTLRGLLSGAGKSAASSAVKKASEIAIRDDEKRFQKEKAIYDGWKREQEADQQARRQADLRDAKDRIKAAEHSTPTAEELASVAAASEAPAPAETENALALPEKPTPWNDDSREPQQPPAVATTTLTVSVSHDDDAGKVTMLPPRTTDRQAEQFNSAVLATLFRKGAGTYYIHTDEFRTVLASAKGGGDAAEADLIMVMLTKAFDGHHYNSPRKSTEDNSFGEVRATLSGSVQTDGFYEFVGNPAFRDQGLSPRTLCGRFRAVTRETRGAHPAISGTSEANRDAAYSYLAAVLQHFMTKPMAFKDTSAIPGTHPGVAPAVHPLSPEAEAKGLKLFWDMRDVEGSQADRHEYKAIPTVALRNPELTVRVGAVLARFEDVSAADTSGAIFDSAAAITRWCLDEVRCVVEAANERPEQAVTDAQDIARRICDCPEAMAAGFVTRNQMRELKLYSSYVGKSRERIEAALTVLMLEQVIIPVKVKKGRNTTDQLHFNPDQLRLTVADLAKARR